MGFRTGAYATVWDVESVSDVNTKGRISISRKDKRTDEWVEDFSGFVNFFGTAAARKAVALKRKDRIRLGDVDVRSTYDKAKQITYYNFSIFSFELADQAATASNQASSAQRFVNTAIESAGDGDIDDSNLPF